MNMFKKIYNRWSVLFLLAFLSGTTHAVVIDFDDLVLDPDHPDYPCFCSHPLTNEYESQGLVIDDGYLSMYSDEYEYAVSGPNYLLGGNYLRLSFVGPLPTFVSMYVSSFHGEAMFLTAFGADGLIEMQQTSGWAGPDRDDPYTPNQLIAFTSAQGISSIAIEGFYNMRVSALIDDLNFEYTSVPAPASIILLLSGIVILMWRRSGGDRHWLDILMTGRNKEKTH